MKSAILEVIALSVADAVAAEQGGARRLEVVRALDVGGLTPEVSLVRDILAAVSIPVRVMLGERPSYQTGDEAEIEKLCDSARAFAALGVDGLVVGFLRGKQLDLRTTERVLSRAPGVKATFHRAFEDVEDPAAAIAELKSFGRCDRILTSGDAAKLQRFAELARPEITMLAGAGLTAPIIRTMIETTDIREFHVGRPARRGHDINQPVDADLVRGLVAILAG